MGPVGIQEMIVIFLVALVLFGPKKLPELGKNLAKGLAEFKKAQNELKATFDREMQNLERETASARDAIHQTTNEIAAYSVDNSAHTASSDSTYHEQLLATANPPAINPPAANEILEHTVSDHPISHQPTVSASEVSSAESHVDTSSLHPSLHYGTPVLTPTEGTVSRGSFKAAVAESNAAEANPLPEFGHASAPGARPESSSELPSLV